MFLLRHGCHVCVPPKDKNGDSIQSSLNFGNTLLWIACKRKTAETWFLARLFILQSSIISQILDFIYWMVTILVLITWLVKTENCLLRVSSLLLNLMLNETPVAKKWNKLPNLQTQIFQSIIIASPTQSCWTLWQWGKRSVFNFSFPSVCTMSQRQVHFKNQKTNRKKHCIKVLVWFLLSPNWEAGNGRSKQMVKKKQIGSRIAD